MLYGTRRSGIKRRNKIVKVNNDRRQLKDRRKSKDRRSGIDRRAEKTGRCRLIDRRDKAYLEYLTTV